MNPTLPDHLERVLRAIHASGGRPRVVGGWVRDQLLGLAGKDIDIEVFGLSYERLARSLGGFGRLDFVGRSFGVLKLRGDGWEHDFSLPRRDSKTGSHHRDFEVVPDPNLSDAEAALRRDFTLNAIAWDPFERRIVDPLGGKEDLQRGILRHTGPHFREDPLRVLRGFQLISRFGLEAAPETLAECRDLVPAYSTLAAERVWMEWAKWAERSTHPSAGLRFLESSGWLCHFPELAALVGCPQDPEWHPEGDVWTHTGHCCDAMARLPEWKESPPERRRTLLMAILCHDLGKPATTHQELRDGRLRWVSPGHEPAGGPLAETLLTRIKAPLALVAAVRPLVENHLWHHAAGENPSPTAVRRLARRLSPSNLRDLRLVLLADHFGRPPLVKEATLDRIQRLEIAARNLDLETAAPRPILLGRHLIAAGLKPGPDFGTLLDAAFEAQLDGAFADEAGALRYLKSKLAQISGNDFDATATTPSGPRS